MRIVVIVDHDIELLNGASLQSRQLVTWLAANGHEVELVYPSRGRPRRKPTPGIRHRTLPAFTVSSYKEYCIPLPPLAVSLWARRWEADLIHAETINPTLLMLGYWIKKRRRIPMFNVLTANVPYYAPILLTRENVARRIVIRLGKALMNRVSNRIDGTFILSPGMRKALTQDFYSIDQRRVFPLLRPLDSEAFTARRSPTDVFRRFPVPKGFRLVTLSRLCPTKNVAFLVRTFARHIYPGNRSLHFFVAGRGPLEARLKEEAAASGCPNIHFPGEIPFEAVPAFLGEADYFLFGSLSETFGNAVCESKYVGLPVLAVDDGGGIRAQIVDRRTGILVRNPTGEEFARRFFELYADAVLQEEIRRQARRDVQINHLPDKIYRNLLQLYARAVRGQPPDGPEFERAFTCDRSFLDSNSKSGSTRGTSFGEGEDIRSSGKEIPV